MAGSRFPRHNGYLRNSKPLLRRFNDLLLGIGKGVNIINLSSHFCGKGPEAGRRVSYSGSRQPRQDQGKSPISQSFKQRHMIDLMAKAISQDQIIAFLNFSDQFRDMLGMILSIGIGMHDNIGFEL